VYPKAKLRGFHALEFVSTYLDAVEINTSFYQPLRPEVTRLWMKKAEHNPRFVFTAKLNRRFTHDRILDQAEIARFKEGLWPLRAANRLGCLLMQFPSTFRFTEENRNWFVALRRAFHEFPLAAEMRHPSWTSEEALGVFIDYRVGFCNIDHPVYTNGMPPAALLTSPLGYVRLHGRNSSNALGGSGRDAVHGVLHDYLYEPSQLAEWKHRIVKLAHSAETVFAMTNNDGGGKSFVNALQLQRMFDPNRDAAPQDLLAEHRDALSGFRCAVHPQPCLFHAA
jgi:uncharacterized protein YecE (DUF72 family)